MKLLSDQDWTVKLTEKMVDQSTTHDEPCVISGESPRIHGGHLHIESRTMPTREKLYWLHPANV